MKLFLCKIANVYTKCGAVLHVSVDFFLFSPKRLQVTGRVYMLFLFLCSVTEGGKEAVSNLKFFFGPRKPIKILFKSTCKFFTV